MTVDISAKWALVAESSRSVGREIARVLAKLGCNLLLQARSPAHLAPIAEQLAPAPQHPTPWSPRCRAR